jgi:hypothetical protein
MELGLQSMHTMVIAHLFRHATCAQKINLGQIYGIDHWLTSAYREICTAPALPDGAEYLLSALTIGKIARTQEKLMAMGSFSTGEKYRIVDEDFGRPRAITDSVLPSYSD